MRESLTKTIALLENLASSQNKAAKAVKVGDLGRAHINLKAARCLLLLVFCGLQPLAVSRSAG